MCVDFLSWNLMTLLPSPISSSSSSFYSSSKISLPFPTPRGPRTNSIATARHGLPSKDKIVVIMGATGCGKSGLSVQLASRFPSEIINSDKMQVYNGLDITTNKIPLHERHGVPHHLLGDYHSLHHEFTPLDFRIHADNVVSELTSRMKLPILVGGSNSFIHALLVNHFDPNVDVFDGSRFISSDLRYRCCFLWLDVSFPVLSDYLSIRVDDMLELGMFEELAGFYDPDEADGVPYTGIRKAIGVPEFDMYFKLFPPDKKTPLKNPSECRKRREAYEEVVKAIKVNTHLLAEKQIGKILRLKQAGWDINVLNATEAFRVVVESDSGKNRSEIWEKQVLEPSLKIVKRFLEKEVEE